jgi:hypothetical protein
MPSKALTSKFEDDALVGSKGVALETWLNRVLWHPILRNASCMTMFLSQTDDKGWKEDRRTCEKDKQINSQFYGTVGTEGNLPENIDTQLTDYKKFVFALEKAVRQVQAIKVFPRHCRHRVWVCTHLCVCVCILAGHAGEEVAHPGGGLQGDGGGDCEAQHDRRRHAQLVPVRPELAAALHGLHAHD